MGLLIIVGVGLPHAGNLPELTSTIFGSGELVAAGIMSGALLAFYAFIGFEDMIDVAEEVKNPSKTMPRAIFVSLLTATGLYLAVVMSALLVLTPQELAASKAPLADVYASATGQPPTLLTIIGLTATVNGILVQIIMGSRILYGLSNRGWIHGSFSKVHRVSRVPVTATLVVTAAILILAVSLPLIKLAELTSTIILCVFAMVHIALIILKLRGPINKRHHQVPLLVPVFGAIASVTMLVAGLVLP